MTSGTDLEQFSDSSVLSSIRDLRFNQGFTLEQISSEIGFNYEKVRRICHEEAIIRPRSIDKRLSQGQKLSFRHAYLSNKWTNKQLASQFKISIPSVKRLAKRMELPLKKSIDHPQRKELFNQTAELYKNGFSTKQIGDKLGIGDEAARNYLKKQGIKRRHVNGLSKCKITRQNNIIREMYLNGNKLKEIEKAAGMGVHGISKRLKVMGIERSRNPYNPIGTKYDGEITSLFLSGKNIVEIAKATGLTNTAVSHRLKKHIFLNAEFKLLYYSNLTEKWKKMGKRYATFRQLEHAKQRVRKYVGKNIRFRIRTIKPRIKAKHLNRGNNYLI